MLHGRLSGHGGHVLRVGLGGDNHGRSRLVGSLLRRRRRHVLMLVGTRLPSRLIVMRRRRRIVLLRIAVWVVHRRRRRRMVIRVRVVLLLPPRLGVHRRPWVHVLAGPGRHVMVVHHDAGGGAADGGGLADPLSRLWMGEGRRAGRRSASYADPAPTFDEVVGGAVAPRAQESMLRVKLSMSFGCRQGCEGDWSALTNPLAILPAEVIGDVRTGGVAAWSECAQDG